MNDESVTDNDTVIDDPVAEPAHQVVHDPVCHMNFDATTAAGTAEYQGLTYYFCSVTCHQAFDVDPDGILEKERSYSHEDTPQEADASDEQVEPETGLVTPRSSLQTTPSALLPPRAETTGDTEPTTEFAGRAGIEQQTPSPVENRTGLADDRRQSARAKWLSPVLLSVFAAALGMVLFRWRTKRARRRRAQRARSTDTRAA